jgi:hypothetical protein
VTSDLAARLSELEATVRRLTDREAVLTLTYNYQRLCDGGWAGSSHSDPAALSALFTDSARYALPEQPVARGKAHIQALFVHLQEHVPWIVHYLANPFVTVEGDRAVAEIKGMACFWRGTDRTLTFGTYYGQFMRTSEGWRFTDWEFVRAQQPHPAVERFGAAST